MFFDVFCSFRPKTDKKVFISDKKQSVLGTTPERINLAHQCSANQ